MVKKNFTVMSVFLSRRLILLFIIILFLFLGIENFVQNQTHPETEPFSLNAIVEKVVDGDTIILKGGKKVRYLGINAPEIRVWNGKQWVARSQIGGEEAKKFNQRLVGGKKVILEYDREKLDAYNRILAYVWANGVLVNGELVKRGLALTDFRPPNLKYQKMFSDFQQEARNFRRGIWGEIENYSYPHWQANKLIGELGAVEGKIISVNPGKEKIYFHFGKEWEKDFTVIIYKANLTLFSLNPGELKTYFLGKKIKVYGVVRHLEGPAIIVSAPSQIDILQ